MSKTLEVLFSPAEFATLPARDLSETVCVVFDVLRATSSMITALSNGATAIYPVETIAEALAFRAKDSAILLAGERGGLRITAELTGGTEFDLGNSPREFTPAAIAGKHIAWSTTNGTRALRACARARHTLVSCLLNLRTTGDWILNQECRRVILVCGGTYEEASLEDTLAAGALADVLWSQFDGESISDAAQVARQLWLQWRHDLPSAMALAKNARRLLARPNLRDDVPFCLQLNKLRTTSCLDHTGAVKQMLT